MDAAYMSVNNVLNDYIQGRRLYLTLRSSYFEKIIACIYLKIHIISQVPFKNLYLDQNYQNFNLKSSHRNIARKLEAKFCEFCNFFFTFYERSYLWNLRKKKNFRQPTILLFLLEAEFKEFKSHRWTTFETRLKFFKFGLWIY